MTNTINTYGPYNEFNRSWDWILYEQAYYSREKGLFDIQPDITESGMVIGQITGGNFVPWDPTATDGSEVVKGILIYRVDTTTAVREAVYLARHASTGYAGLLWGANVTTQAEKDAAILELDALGIVVRGDA